MAERIYPNWGQSLGQGIAGGFDSAVQGLMAGMNVRMQNQRLQRQQQMQGLQFQADTGYDPDRLIAGQTLAAQPPNAPTSQQSSLLDEYNTFQETLRNTATQNTAYKKSQTEINNWLLDQFKSGAGTGPQVTTKDGIKYMKRVSRSGISWSPLPYQKGNEGAVQVVNDALQSFSNVDDYFDAVEGKALSKLSQAEIFGLSAFMYPDVAQKEAALFVPFQFAQGGKALTEPEKELIMSLGKNPAFGPEERMGARIELKKLLFRRVKGNIEANLLGPAREMAIRELQSVQSQYGIKESKSSIADRMTELQKLRLPESKIFQILDEEGYNP